MRNSFYLVHTTLTNLYITHTILYTICIILCGKWLIASTFLCPYWCFRWVHLTKYLLFFPLVSFLACVSVCNISIRYIVLFFENNIVTIDMIWLICTWHTHTHKFGHTRTYLTVIWWIGLKSFCGREEKKSHTFMSTTLYFLYNFVIVKWYENSEFCF